jgi:hypothetical protein
VSTHRGCIVAGALRRARLDRARKVDNAIRRAKRTRGPGSGTESADLAPIDLEIALQPHCIVCDTQPFLGSCVRRVRRRP